jgi:hypothetical protein
MTPIHPTNATAADYRAYTEAFRHGVSMAAGDLSRAFALKIAETMSAAASDAFLAGYTAELRRLRNTEDLDRP